VTESKILVIAAVHPLFVHSCPLVFMPGEKVSTLQSNQVACSYFFGLFLATFLAFLATFCQNRAK
jgi:hypothetical protein